MRGRKPRLTDALLKQAQRAAVKHSDLTAKITEAFEARYGCTHSDVDADEIIDSLDYGGGSQITVEECDSIMTDAGHPPLSPSRRQGA